jgi:adenosylhomocysteine nucleosidase
MTEASIAIFAALADEIRIMRSKMQIDESVHVRPARIDRGTYDSRDLLLIRTGIGRNAMSKAAGYCIETFHPAICFNVGYCGGATPDIETGDLVIAERVVHDETGEEIVCPPELVDKAKKICSDSNLRFSSGGIVTVDTVVHGPHDKAYLGTKNESRAVDMESFAFAKECHDKGVPFAVVRSCLDPMDMLLPDLEGTVDEEGKTDIAGAIKKMIQKPKTILAIPRIEYCAVQAREAIDEFLKRLMRSL